MEHTAYNISIRQTPVIDDPNKARMDWYIEHPQQESKGRVISVLSWKIRRFNEYLIERFSSKFGLDLTLIKSNPEYENLINCGAVGV